MHPAKSATPIVTRAQASEEIARIDALARHHRTPCGDGYMVWREWGAGPALVLLHGGFGSWLHWIRNVEALAAHFRVLAADTPGLGESAALREPVSPEQVGDVVYAGLERLLPADDACDILAFSFGGVVASQVGPRLGSRLGTLVLVGASGFGIPRTRPVEMIRRTPEMSEAERDAARRHNIMALMLARRENLDELAFEIQVRNDNNARMKSRRFSLGASLRDALPDLKGKVNGIWGELDATASPTIESRRELIAKTHPDTDFRVLKGAGHWVAYEASLAFNDVVLEMLGPGKA